MAITRNDKEYNLPLFVEELRRAGVDTGDVRVFGAHVRGEWTLKVDVLADDTDGSIAQAVEDVADSHDASEKTDGERLQAARGTIQDLRSVARNYAGDVAALYAAVIAADAAGDTAQERYDRIRQAVADADTPFRVRLTLALAGETGIDVNGQGLSNLTPAEKQSVNAFARRFANSLAMLLTM